MQPLRSRPTSALSGVARVPGDKSISHRSLMLGALAVGETVIEGLLEGEDVLRTAAAMRALGTSAVRESDGRWRVHGRGIGGLQEPGDVLDLGNAGTGARLLMGLLATHRLTAFLTGDASLRSRPMARVAKPLQEIGARIVARDGCRLPLAIIGAAEPVPISYRLPVASAQVKSAVLLAGLNTPGETSVIEPEPTRDHTELMLRHFGVEVRVEMTSDGRRTTIVGQPEITGRRIAVPADPSSAAFPLVAALLLPGSDVTLSNVGINPHRIGLIETLREMGADITFVDQRQEAGEPVADIRVRASRLRGVKVPAARAPSMIDEYPVLAVAAACAGGTTVMEGLGELRVKESDRLAAVAKGLRACGASVQDGPDSLAVQGGGGRPRGGGGIVTNLDHRIAMAFLVMGMVAEQPIEIDDGSPIETSFPGFTALMNGLGAQIAPFAGSA
ncbi:MAG TPA: 3-phosphoshikimate 1-carboxyvinyltransferase [Candidatus Angelobacter sp.]|nr:3-phosphoshikimate 1-carboxyvinyltransferase [Candidatus Angelobacter sp.]